MSRDELADNLGTIARSGTQGFMSQMSGDAAKDVHLIGQFGVGFYSAFMVADQVEVISRHAGEEHSWRWRSDGRSGFTIEPTEQPAPRGTAVVLKLREDAKEFLDEYRLRQIVRSYSDHIAVPILLQGEARADGEHKEASDKETAKEPEQINQASALWTRPKSEITDEQYKEFYHHVAHAFDDPWGRLHVQAEGLVSYQALLFLPGTAPFDLYDPQRQHGVKLYVRRVFITGDLEGLMPRYLRFVKGVVDSEDLQLNVSRETLQHSPVLAKIRRDLVKRVLDELDRRAKADQADYQKFWDSFGAVLKEGMYEDHEQRERLLELARFHSTAGDGWVSLADYVGRMKPGQDAIFTISGENLDALRASPQLEACRAKGVEVLLLSDPIDEFWMPSAHTYKDKPFRSLTRGDVDLSKIESPEAEAGEAEEQQGRGRRDGSPDRGVQGAARRQGAGRPAVLALDRERGLPGRRGARHGPAPRALPQAAPAARPAVQAGAGDQSQACADQGDGPGRRGRWPEGGAGRPGRAAARSGAHRRGRAGARSGRLLPPDERVPDQGTGSLAQRRR